MVATFTGRGNKKTSEIKVAANWQIMWKIKAGKSFTVELLDNAGQSRGEIVNAKKKAQGTTFVSGAGVFRLNVAADGEWTIKIVSQPVKK